jgi:hypothetical protein
MQARVDSETLQMLADFRGYVAENNWSAKDPVLNGLLGKLLVRAMAYPEHQLVVFQFITGLQLPDTAKVHRQIDTCFAQLELHHLLYWIDHQPLRVWQLLLSVGDFRGQRAQLFFQQYIASRNNRL